jgi:hypothetical protein
MKVLTAAIIAALALPVLALAALVADQEWQRADARILSVPLRGYDPRDLLRGHYLLAQIDWDWEGEPQGASGASVKGAACVVVEQPRPRVRFLAGGKTGDPAATDCRFVLAGRGWPRDGTRPAGFVPGALDAGGAAIRFYVPEDRASELEQRMRERPGALTADLAVRADGSVAIKALRIDGTVLGR